MIEFVLENLLLLPFLFATYLVLEAVEAHSGGALERFLERSRSVGPLAGALAGIIPQCGVSAAAASFYAGGVVSVGALLAVFLSTSDELVPVLISAAPQVGVDVLLRIVGLKAVAAVAVGFAADGLLLFMRHRRRSVSIGELCRHSRCHCAEHDGIVMPALIHTGEVFLFILIVSGAVELCLHYFGLELVSGFCRHSRLGGSLLAGLLGMIPNCAVSVAGAQLFAEGAIGPEALMASSFTGSGVGILVLLRTNRNWRENLAIVLAIYVIGTVLGMACGGLIAPVAAN